MVVNKGAFTVSTAEALIVPLVALIVDVVLASTGLVLTTNVPVVWPASTVTVPVTVAAPVLDDVTVAVKPPEGAGPVKVTVPVEEVPPVTVVGFSVRVLTLAGTSVILPVAEKPLNVAVTVSLELAVTVLDVTVTFCWYCPTGKVTVAGADKLELVCKVTVSSAGTGLLSCTLTVSLLPLTSVAGEGVTFTSATGTYMPARVPSPVP